MTPLALDTSVAVPLLVRSHPDHALVAAWFDGRTASLGGHAVAETYSVLTRGPGDLRVAPDDAVALMDAAFASPMILRDTTWTELPRRLARAGVSGGAVYDALVAFAALEHDAELATRDARAHATYAAVGVRLVVVA